MKKPSGQEGLQVGPQGERSRFAMDCQFARLNIENSIQTEEFLN